MHYVDAMCALNICSSLALFPPSMWPTLIINFKLLSSWREKGRAKPVRKIHSEFTSARLNFTSRSTDSYHLLLKRTSGFSTRFPSLSIFSFGFGVSLMAPLAPSVSLKAADVVSMSRCFEFTALQSRLSQILIQQTFTEVSPLFCCHRHGERLTR